MEHQSEELLHHYLNSPTSEVRGLCQFLPLINAINSFFVYLPEEIFQVPTVNLLLMIYHYCIHTCIYFKLSLYGLKTKNSRYGFETISLFKNLHLVQNLRENTLGQ